ncbi:unnamed protein product [Parnassius mnemosyne]|uniref:Drebrin-like protein n=1 Tax=Parnassius mnemosyne TaxID=213953 RepID=A0AAV1KXD6_9NEOP
MAINLEKHREALIAAWKDVLDEKTDTNWALFGYDGLSNDLKFISKGDGGLTELIDDFNSGKIQYAFLKVDVPTGSISKYVLINWQGEGAPTVRKGTCANHVKHVAQFFTGFHLTMHARTEDDLDEKIILDKLAKAGSAFNFKSSRQEELPPSGPVGTTYKKVNPVQEINSKERDQFWLKEEQEEKKRVEAEKKRREEEKRKAEEEVRRRDELEAARRAKAEQQKAEAEAAAEVAAGGADGVSASEALRRQRSAEARRLIGASTAAARALFQQNLAQGQLSARSNSTPDKPVRGSVIAQRINTFSQSTSPQPTTPVKSPTKLEKTTLQEPTNEEPNDQLKTSPLKNIDKIKMSLESPSQIQYEPIIDPSVDLSPSTENEPSSFSAINYSEYNETTYRDIEGNLQQSEPMIKQNILENDMFDASYSSSNENDDDDSDNKFSTIKRSPYTKNTDAKSELSRQNTVIENVNYKKENGTTTLDDVSPEGMDDEGTIYEDLDDDPGLTARALYDYQAADESEITFDPGDIITHIEQIDAGWWQGLGPRGVFGLFPANYVELLPCPPR